jgi:hypothetical protein
MRQVARNVRDLATGIGIDEDTACCVWALGVAGLEHACTLDPIVGGVSGIGRRCSPTCACAAASML